MPGGSSFLPIKLKAHRRLPLTSIDSMEKEQSISPHAGEANPYHEADHISCGFTLISATHKSEGYFIWVSLKHIHCRSLGIANADVHE